VRSLRPPGPAKRRASLTAHEAIVALGFEGTVLKRLGSAYRPGRNPAGAEYFFVPRDESDSDPAKFGIVLHPRVTAD
jgi:hypothetical protein